jgi:hypothetical protein
VEACKAGVKIVDVCELGDKYINECAIARRRRQFKTRPPLPHLFSPSPLGQTPRRAVGKEFKGKDIEKGIAVPTCVSVNKCAARLSSRPHRSRLPLNRHRAQRARSNRGPASSE